jgi:hypothetical protein
MNDAEKFVMQYFKDHKNVDLIPAKPKRGEAGYDFRNQESTLFIEVKGSKHKHWSKVLFVSLTAAQYEKLKECHTKDLKFELHLVFGVGSDDPQHYIISQKELLKLDRLKPEVSWHLYVTKEIHDQFKVNGRK